LGYSLFTVADLPVAGLMKMPGDGQKTGAPPHWIGYVGDDDVDAVVDRIKQLGGAVHVPPTDVPGCADNGGASL
jgi:predicted enzyme related to lactoylglutathione lyase